MAGDAFAAHPWVEKTRIGPVLAVRTSATSTPAFEYVHADHLGSPAAATDAAGAELLALAHDPYGARRKADWTARLPAAEARALAAGQDAGRTRAGFTGHETLDRTGFVHMNGRLYDPRLGRFLSPDPVVSEPWSGQGWNPYSYVGNSPLSRTDPTGYCYHESMPCAGQGGGFPGGGGGGSTALSGVLWTRTLTFAPTLVLNIEWGPVPSVGGGWDWFRLGGFFGPDVTLGAGPPTPVFSWDARPVSLGQEPMPADAPMEHRSPTSARTIVEEIVVEIQTPWEHPGILEVPVRSVTELERRRLYERSPYTRIRVDRSVRREIRDVLKSPVFEDAASGIMTASTKAKRELGALRVFEKDGAYHVYSVGTPDPMKANRMTLDPVDEDLGRHVFDWHPHPGGSRKPSPADLRSSFRLGVPGVIRHGKYRRASTIYQGGCKGGMEC